jgi:hypothetical protein
MLNSHGISQSAAARTLVADSRLGGNDTPSAEDYQDGLAALLQSVQDAVGDNWVKPEYGKTMAHSCSQRKFAVMSNGSPGLVPKLTRPSDRVIMIPGARIYFLALRPYDNGFLFLGECYIDGWGLEQEHYGEFKQRAMNETPGTFRIK